MSEREALDRAERELIRRMEAQGQSIPVVTVETVELDGKTLYQLRISDPEIARHQVAGLDRPVFVPFTLGEPASTDADGVAPHIAIVQKVGEIMRRGEVAVKPVVVFLVVRPGRRVRTWVEGLDRNLEPAEQALLTKRTSEIATGDVDRTFAIAIMFPRVGQPINAFDVGMPSEWRAASKRAGRPLSLDELLQIVWPEPPAPR